ncbi:MAG: hypothetical protein JEZ04_01630 [Spirochaetales bacterium]|nr:hypothetical protein [Spirochaetales bacterium]
MRIPLILIGFGSMGREIAEAALSKPWLEIIGLVDPDPKFSKLSLRELLSRPDAPAINITPSLKEWLSSSRQRLALSECAAMAVAATSSRLADIEPVLETLFSHDISVVSTCEEMSYPLPSNEDIWNRIDNLAVRYGTSAAGTGINPGFLMDLLPLLLTAPCTRIEAITINRSLDIRRRRTSFQQKMGKDLTAEEFENGRRAGIIGGHIGLEVSLRILAGGMGWSLAEIIQTPMKRLGSTDRVIGITQGITGITTEGKRIKLNFTASEDSDEEDRITIDGEPEILQVIKPGIQGDKGTAAMVLHSIPGVLKAAPGLHTILDLPIPRFY